MFSAFPPHVTPRHIRCSLYPPGVQEGGRLALENAGALHFGTVWPGTRSPKQSRSMLYDYERLCCSAICCMYVGGCMYVDGTQLYSCTGVP